MDKNWLLFLMSLGFLLISTSPLAPNSLMFIVSGSVLVVFSGLKLLKDKK